MHLIPVSYLVTYPLSLVIWLSIILKICILSLAHVQLLAEFPGFQLEERGEMDIKGKGK